MDISQTLTLFATGLISISLLLLALQVKFAKHLKNNEEQNLNTSFALWVGSIFLSACFVISKMLVILNDALKIHKSIKSEILDYFKTISIFIGLYSIWILILILIVNSLSKLVFGSRSEKLELTKNNQSFFILKSLFLIGSAFALLSIFEGLLKIFMPTIQTPFYH